MNKLLLLTKVDLLRTLNLKTINNSKYKSERRKKTVKTLSIIIIISYLLWYIYYLTTTLMPFFITVGKPLYLIAFLFTICTLYIFFANIFKIKSVLFDFKDYDLLMSLPVNRNIVIASKLLSLYFTNLLYTLLIMIPGFIGYIKFATFPHPGLFFCLLLTVPLIPILASSIIGIIITWLTSFFKNKNVGSYIVNLSLILLVFTLTFHTNKLNELTIVNHSISMVDSFSKFYPFTTLFVDLLENFSIMSLGIYFLVPICLTSIFILLLDKCYISLRHRLLKNIVKNDYEIQNFKKSSLLKSLYVKELKKYFSNSLYVINTSFGCLLLLFLILSLILFDDYMLSHFQEMFNNRLIIRDNVFMIFSLLCAISSTTNSAISLEGKSLWIIKMLPVSIDKIFLSKIMVNLTILLPTIIIGGTFFGIYLHLSIMDFILIYLMPLVYAIFASLNGLLLNIIFPKFDFDSEIKVIKQSLAVFLTILLGIIVVIVPFSILEINTNSLILITCIIALIDIIFIVILHTYGNEKFKKL